MGSGSISNVELVRAVEAVLLAAEETLSAAVVLIPPARFPIAHGQLVQKRGELEQLRENFWTPKPRGQD